MECPQPLRQRDPQLFAVATPLCIYGSIRGLVRYNARLRLLADKPSSANLPSTGDLRLGTIWEYIAQAIRQAFKGNDTKTNVSGP